jgi:hydrogenase expression/formation protein HypD
MSGWQLRPEFNQFNAEKRFPLANIQTNESTRCIAGKILQGIKKPFQCEAFATLCTPENPLGATMVSSEGTCAAYYRYRSRS